MRTWGNDNAKRSAKLKSNAEAGGQVDPLVMCDAPTKDQVATALNQLSEDMLSVGVAMEYLGGFNEGWKEKSAELIGASRIAKVWFDEI